MTLEEKVHRMEEINEEVLLKLNQMKEIKERHSDDNGNVKDMPVLQMSNAVIRINELVQDVRELKGELRKLADGALEELR